MTDESNQPDWKLLPYRPREFFGLEIGFVRTDLRLRYSQLIRKFKPDKFPDEFQRIRAAYELLDQQIHFNPREFEESVSPGFDDDEMIAALSTHDATIEGRAWRSYLNEEANRFRIDEQALLKRIQTQSPESVYCEIEAQKTKQPSDYFALAILSDVLYPEDEGKFGKWLLAGLQEFQYDSSLNGLLRAYFNGPIPPQAISELLMRTSEILKDDRFYYITNPLWRQLLESMEFPTFQNLLERCEANLHDFSAHSKVILYLDLLNHGIWKADLDWIDSKIAFVDENYNLVPPHRNFDADLLGIKRQYAEQRSQFLDGNPMREMMDDALRKHLSHQDSDDLDMLACQLQIANHPDSLLQAFILDENKQKQQFEPFYLLWNVASQTLLNRESGSSNSVPDPKVWQPMVDRLLLRFDEYQWTTWPGFRMQWIDFGCKFIVLLLFIIMPLFVSLLSMAPILILGFSESLWLPVAALVGSLLGLTVAFRMNRRYLKPFHVHQVQLTQSRILNRFWRRDLVCFMKQTQLDHRTISNLMGNCDVSSFPNGQLGFQLFSQEIGLAIFSIAQRCK